jgi:YidC/Oxa1 family membrane protein insertase
VGILNPLFDAVAWIIMQIHAGLSHVFGADSGWSWGLSIVFLVIFLRLLMVPLFVKQVNSQRKMLAVMPQLKELQKRYKNDRQRLNEETMKFYKENGVNPLGGCLPMLAQFPVFISLFQVLRAIADWKPGQTPKFGLTTQVVQSALNARVFGVRLSDTFLFHHPPVPWSVRGVILASVLISAGTTFITMRQSTKRGMMNTTPDPDNPMAQSQKYMMYIAPFFALTGLYWQYGLVIYWVTNNLWTMGQQHFMYRNLPVVGSAGATGAIASANGSGGAKTATGTARSSSAKSGARPGAKSPAKSGTATPKTGTSAKTLAAKSAASKSAASKSAAGKTSASKSAAGKPDEAESPSRPAMRGLLRVGKKAEPEPEPAEEPSAKIVRQQPVRQTRSKRSGRR